MACANFAAYYTPLAKLASAFAKASTIQDASKGEAGSFPGSAYQGEL
jgi:hypothetical protein